MSKKQHVPQFDVHASCMGGRTIAYGGYVFEFQPGHRLQNQWGFVAQHRLVAEAKLGRQLRLGEVVHHIDKCSWNNHPDNLLVMSAAAHHRLHAQQRAEAAKSRLTAEMVVKALDGRSLKDAATELGCHTQTLRNRFPDLVAPRKRRTPTRIDDPKAIAVVLKYAPDPNVELRDVVRLTGMSAMTALRICKRNGVQWVKKTRKGEVKRTYRGRPTLRWSEEHGQLTELAAQQAAARPTHAPEQLPSLA
jgi:hypothetical protein